MTTTINISLPKELYKEAKKLIEKGRYASMSELMRAGVRRILYDVDQITENGFPTWFEDQVLEASAQPLSKNDVVIETDEDIHKYFRNRHKKPDKRKTAKDGKNNRAWQVPTATR